MRESTASVCDEQCIQSSSSGPKHGELLDPNSSTSKICRIPSLDCSERDRERERESRDFQRENFIRKLVCVCSHTKLICLFLCLT